MTIFTYKGFVVAVDSPKELAKVEGRKAFRHELPPEIRHLEWPHYMRYKAIHGDFQEVDEWQIPALQEFALCEEEVSDENVVSDILARAKNLDIDFLVDLEKILHHPVLENNVNAFVVRDDILFSVVQEAERWKEKDILNEKRLQHLQSRVIALHILTELAQTALDNGVLEGRTPPELLEDVFKTRINSLVEGIEENFKMSSNVALELILSIERFLWLGTYEYDIRKAINPEVFGSDYEIYIVAGMGDPGGSQGRWSFRLIRESEINATPNPFDLGEELLSTIADLVLGKAGFRHVSGLVWGHDDAAEAENILQRLGLSKMEPGKLRNHDISEYREWKKRKEEEKKKAENGK